MTLYEPNNTIQAAFFAKLTGDATLIAYSGVYDHVPESAAFPYVKVGEIEAHEKGVFDREGWDCYATLHLYSQHEGNQELYKLLSDCNRILNKATFVVSDGSVPFCLFDHTTAPLEDPDGVTRQLVVRYHVIVEA